VHVITKKGKGYKPAEENPDKFHGIGIFDVSTGKTPESKRASYTDIFGEALCEIASANKKVLAISAAMPTGTGLTNFRKKFPERFFDVGIAEQHAVTMAASLAVSGYIPVVAIYSTFLQRAYDQILHDVAIQGLHVVFAIDRAGLVGEDGETHQGVFDISYLRHIPGMVIMAPKDENELRNMLLTATEYNGPIALRYPRGAGTGEVLTDKPQVLPIGRAQVLTKGKDVTIAAIGSSVNIAMEAAKALAEKGVKATVINARFVKPLDCDCLKASVALTGRLVTLEENVLQGGFGSAVLEFLNDNGVKAQIKRIGIPDEFISHGPAELLRKTHGLSLENVVAEVMQMMAGSGKSPRRAAEIKLMTQP
jgi:1-deoxy-D-xylulose-5-phosphate synthase